MKLTIGTTFWSRPRIEILTMLYYVKLAETAGIDVELVAAVSEDWADIAAKSMGWRTVRCNNAPLGAKHNVMLAEVRETKPDAFILIGSDDWLVSRAPFSDDEANPLARLATFVEYRPLVGLTDLWVMDLPGRQALWWSNPPQIIGPGRMMRSDVLDEADWHLWPPGAEKGLDAKMTRRLSGTWSPLSWVGHNLACIDFKTGINIWGFEAFEKRAKPVGYEEVLIHALPAWARDDLQSEWGDRSVSRPESVR